ncbi:hypothetical protein ACFL0A_01565 [Patescibacteria group bacterium]
MKEKTKKKWKIIGAIIGGVWGLISEIFVYLTAFAGYYVEGVWNIIYLPAAILANLGIWRSTIGTVYLKFFTIILLPIIIGILIGTLIGHLIDKIKKQ